MKFPMLEKRVQPRRIGQVIGELSEAVPLLAVSQVDPRGHLAKTVLVKITRCLAHGNAINRVDSLHKINYALVMSIAAIAHCSNASFGRPLRIRAVAHR